MQPSAAGQDNTRLFVVCGKAVQEQDLAAFHSYGAVTSLRVIKEKGVAYVRYDRASSAALAIENLNGATLNDGRGPKLKVLLAETPNTRGLSLLHRQLAEMELASDPDNVPPRSRLFLVVPKQADVQQLQVEASAFPDLEYCKTDMVASKGVAFLKFSKTSSALIALEVINERGTFAGYKVKAMLAVPKTKRGRMDGDMLYNLPQAAKLEYMTGMDPLKLQMAAAAGLSSPMTPLDYPAIGGFLGFANNNNNLGTLGAAFAANMGHLPAEMQFGNQGLGNFMGNQLATSSPASSAANNAAGVPLSKQRLFVVVHKGVNEDAIARLFRRFPGMEYCDLKKDRETGKSKGYCYINYSTPEAASAAVAQLNGSEFPPYTGHKIKVMFAEPLGVRPSLAHGSQTPPDLSNLGVHGSSPSPLAGTHTPLSGTHTASLTPDPISSVSDTFASMSMRHMSPAAPGSVPTTVEENLVKRGHGSPSMTTPVARELMYNVN